MRKELFFDNALLNKTTATKPTLSYNSIDPQIK